MSYFFARSATDRNQISSLRIVLVGDDGENVLVILDQGIQAFIAHIVVGKNENSGLYVIEFLS